jgi:hypothetical protein
MSMPHQDHMFRRTARHLWLRRCRGCGRSDCPVARANLEAHIRNPRDVETWDRYARRGKHAR